MLGDLIASVLKNPSDQKIPMPERDLFDQVGEFCRDLYGSRPINGSVGINGSKVT